MCKASEPSLTKKPEIVNHNNEKGTCMFIDVAIYRERSVIKKEAEKILK
jgi:hypothetical protein